MHGGPWRRMTIGFLLLQGVGAALWWRLLIVRPESRRAFLPVGWPEETLLAFLVPDTLLFCGAALLGAWALWRRAGWAWPVLYVHAGAAVYAALYTVSLPWWTGAGWLGALLMAPSLVLLPYLLWRLRREGEP